MACVDTVRRTLLEAWDYRHPIPVRDAYLAEHDSINTAVSVRTAEGSLVFHTLGHGLLEDLVHAGPDEILAGAQPRGRLAPTVFPMSGLHLDPARREAAFWTAETLDDPATPPRWPGWPFTGT